MPSKGAAAFLAALAGAHAPDMASALPYGHPSPSKDYPTRDNFTLWLVEEFDAPLDLDTDPIWTWSDGGLSEGQVRFVKDALTFEGGSLKVEVRQQFQPGSCSNAEVGYVMDKNLSSGELRTRRNMFRFGYYEARMRAPEVQPDDPRINGNYISTIFAYRDAKFRHWREIDIEVTGDTPDSVTMNVLNAENTVLWNPDIQATQNFNAEGQNVRSDFHTFAFEWLPTGITWYFDGEVIGHHGPDNPLPIPDLSTKIMMNLWIFGVLYDFGGPHGANNRYPMHSEYDWFRFYKWDGDTSYPCDDASDSCLTDDDKFLSSNNPCDGIAQEPEGSAPCVAQCASPAGLRAASVLKQAQVQGGVVYP